MSLEEPRGSRDSPPRPRLATRAASFLIVALLIAGIFYFYGVRGAGKGDNPPTVATNAVSTPTPSPTPSQVIPTPTQALFYDTFLDNRNKWALSYQAGFTRALVDGRLILTNANPQTTLVESLPNEMTYNDFTLTVTFALQIGDANDSVGFYLRGDNNLDHDYRVEISGNNLFDVAKEYLDQQSMPQTLMLEGPESVPALHPPGQLNTLTATLQGPMLSMTINNTLVSTVTDSDYSSGQVALFARHGTSSAGVSMAISSIEIDRLV